MGIEISMSSKTLMTQFANSLHVLVKGVLGHLLHELEGHLVGHAVVQGDVVPVLLDHFTSGPGAFIRPGFGDHGQQLMCGSCHIRNVLIGIEYQICHRTLDVYLLFAIWMG
jgi:hypothetical protein